MNTQLCKQGDQHYVSMCVCIWNKTMLKPVKYTYVLQAGVHFSILVQAYVKLQASHLYAPACLTALFKTERQLSLVPRDKYQQTLRDSAFWK